MRRGETRAGERDGRSCSSGFLHSISLAAFFPFFKKSQHLGLRLPLQEDHLTLCVCVCVKLFAQPRRSVTCKKMCCNFGSSGFRSTLLHRWFDPQHFPPPCSVSAYLCFLEEDTVKPKPTCPADPVAFSLKLWLSPCVTKRAR